MKAEDIVNKWRTTEETVVGRKNFVCVQPGASAYISSEECSKEL